MQWGERFVQYETLMKEKKEDKSVEDILWLTLSPLRTARFNIVKTSILPKAT